VILLPRGFASCSKNDSEPTPDVDPAVQTKIDDDAIKAYLVAHPDVHATKDDASGLYYQIITEGTGANIISTSLITVDYVGTTLKDTQFGAGTNFTTGIGIKNNIISGWKIGLLKAKKDTKILLILPSALAYGPMGSDAIAPNTVIQFTITVKNVQNF
jgi:FKBP-type peptidyl-prolyl cis-trans isomerase FkpA